MNNFKFHNPVKISFGKGSIAELPKYLDKNDKILLLYGGGSIKKNGVYDQVFQALEGYDFIEMSGIQPNPLYETCMEAVELIKKEKVDFILGVGGGSVIDAAKFIAAAVHYVGADPWDILLRNAPIDRAMPFGCILTLPATGTEMDPNSVISRASTREKLAFSHPLAYPLFSILDPQTTYTLPERQLANGIADAFVHVMEQYMTYPMDAPLQDRMCESVIQTLIEIAPRVLEKTDDYNARATFFWSTTMALNGIISVGLPQDWATHQIGHELTAIYGVDHARSLTIVLPAMWKYKFDRKKAKLAQYGRRVWNIKGDDEAVAQMAIDKTVEFFKSMDMPTSLADIRTTPGECKIAIEKLTKRQTVMGEHRDIEPENVYEILQLAE